MGDTIVGEVLYGINTIYSVQADGAVMQCRIKGKQLRETARSYNPIAPGDIVEVVPDRLSALEGQIIEVRRRRTFLSRFNKKGRAPQIIAANADLAVCVTSPSSPPFRPRFIDRLIVAASAGGLSPVVLMNKRDLECPPETAGRLEHYERMGYRVHSCSARTGQGMEELVEILRGSTAVLVGQSGVGKSSILNSLAPGLRLRVGDVSVKHDRGNHTTNYSSLIILDGGLRVIDTPGVRELELADVLPEEVGFHFRDFSPHSQHCEFQPCLHAGEPGCAVAAAVEAGEIHPDRYESYRRILQELQDTRRPGNG